ncbi:hypothetical protein OIPHN260_35610 [Enterobacter roggenkampii]|uniref:Uncharacterized protein n=1 Tax=Enterobacter roggenkampii TaxID=1812935 RepID=A0AAU9BSL5_9ENTR|nr:hypothetical protein OIPHN260_35610 [Enterobacter roggenkampii]
MFFVVAIVGNDNAITINDISKFVFTGKEKEFLAITIDMKINVGTMYLIEERFVGLSLET